jgi:hypothetical protein
MVWGLSAWTFVGGILLVASILALVFRNKLAQSLFAIVPFGNMKTKVIAGAVIGLMLGGVAIFGAGISSIKGIVTTGGAGLTGAGAGAVTEGVLLDCEYTAGVSSDLNATIRTDTSRTDLINLDVDESFGCADESANMNTLLNITCSRSGNVGTGSEVAVELVAKGDDFLSEVNTNVANEYNLLEKRSVASTVWSGKYQGEIYLDNTLSTSTSDIERDYLTFGAGVKEAQESITVELDKQSCLELNNYTTKNIYIYQRDGADKLVFTIQVQKVP